MKRCHRSLQSTTQPYLQFSFQKSLRVYEKIPYKKIKVEKSISQPQQQYKFNSQLIFQRLLEGDHKPQGSLIKRMPQSIQKQIEASVMAQRKTEIVLNVSKGQQSLDENKQGVETMPNYSETSKMQKQEKVSEQSILARQSQKDYSLIPNQSNLNKNNSDYLRQSQGVKYEITSKNTLPISSSSNILSQTAEIVLKKRQQAGGRFSLNNQIMISKRILQKIVKKGSEGMIEELIHHRSYLAAERDTISNKIKSYFEFQ